MKDQRKWATMQDVADLAAVSKITVSRVLRSPDKVAAKTRQRIQDAIRTLGYVPDEAAGAFSSRRSRMVGALVSTLSGSIFAATIDGLAGRLRQDGYQLLLATTDYSAEMETDIVGTLLGRRPDGLVTTSSQHTQTTRSLLASAGIPVIELWDLPQSPIDSAVGFSNRGAGFAMTRFLFDRGYRRIGFIGSAADNDVRTAMRTQGYSAAIETSGQQEPRTVAVAAAIQDAAQRGAEGLSQMLDSWPDTDAVFCSSDAVALGAVSEARRRGLSIPDTLAIAGFGDFEYAGTFGLELTTVRIPKREIGVKAAEIILDRMHKARTPENDSLGRNIDVGFEIVRRSSA